jgi:hypothetical protein
MASRKAGKDDEAAAPLVSSGNTYGPATKSKPVVDCPCGSVGTAPHVHK